MEIGTQTAGAAGRSKRWMIWTGRVLSAIPVLMFVIFGAFGLTHPPDVVAGMEKFGYTQDRILIVCTLEIVSALLYAFPPTAVLGAILMTGYLGGAVATHVRVHDPGYPMAVLMGFLVWIGLWLRDPRLRELTPIRRRQ